MGNSAMGNGVAVVTVDGVEKWWSPDAGLHPVTFRIDAGELVVVRGRSGSGKSTLLSLLAGWTSPDRGTVSWAPALDARRTAWDGVAVVPQVLALVAELTVAEHVASALTGRSPASGARVAATMARLDLTDLADRFPDEISLGQQQRTAVARAVVAAPALLLADEPTSHQDPGHVEAVLDAFREIAGQGSAVFVASHEPTVVEAATRVIDLTT